MRLLQRLFLILALGFIGGQGPLRAQSMYFWQVTHNSGLAGTLVGLEQARLGLEQNQELLRNTQSTLYGFSIGQEHYQQLRNYAKLLRMIRQFRALKDTVKNMKIPVWTLIPRISLIAPVETEDENGNPLFTDKQVASLSFVPPNLQATWSDADFIQDDETAGATDIKGGGSSFINFDYPHSLSDLKLDVQESDILGDYGLNEEDAVDQLMAHSFENILDAASALAGYGIQMNPQVLATGDKVVAGRLSPAQLKLQASIYQQQAMTIISNLMTCYIDHGLSIVTAQRMVKNETDYWNAFATDFITNGSSRIAFCMNAVSEINQAIGRLENYNRRGILAENEERLINLGKKRKDDGSGYVSFTDGGDFFDNIDQFFNFNPHGEAIKLQAMGISARYSHAQFEDAQGLRNILIGLARMRIASQGQRQMKESENELNRIQLQNASMDQLVAALSDYQAAKAKTQATGWAGLPTLGAAKAW